LDSGDSVVATDNENEPKTTLLLESDVVFVFYFEKFCIAADEWLRVCFERAEISLLLISVVKLIGRGECVLILRRHAAIGIEVASYMIRDLCYQCEPDDSLFILLHSPMSLIYLILRALSLQIVASSTSASDALVLRSEPVLIMSLELVFTEEAAAASLLDIKK
jgi:hypothetical protein